MRPFVNIIRDKRLGKPLSKDEIYYMVNDFTTGKIPDYQMSAMLMAICINGMNDDEILNLTLAMLNSGEIGDLSSIPGTKVDKHSTGGVGDKTTLVLCPLVASCGVKVAKLSGRGLGFTGGTIDKLASIKGFNTSLSNEDFMSVIKKTGACINAQTLNLCPADGKLYALRDVSGTVESIPLIASSIMSKKLASGSDAMVLDVTTGSGAFMKSKEEALLLAKKMVTIGNNAGKKCVARITSMDEPLGYAIGNSLEMKEAIETLKGNGPKDLEEVCLCLGAHMVSLGLDMSYEDGYKKINDVLRSGKGYEKFLEIVQAQGGDISYIEDTSLLEEAPYSMDVVADKSGYISKINAEIVGSCSVVLGAGRLSKEDNIDISSGIILQKKCGDKIQKGDKLAILYSGDKSKLNNGKTIIENAFEISSEMSEPMPLIQEVIE